MSICVDGPALEGFDATQSINVWLSDSELPSMHVTLTLLFEILTFLFGWGKNPSTNKCVCLAFITSNATISPPAVPGYHQLLLGNQVDILGSPLGNHLPIKFGKPCDFF